MRQRREKLFNLCITSSTIRVKACGIRYLSTLRRVALTAFTINSILRIFHLSRSIKLHLIHLSTLTKFLLNIIITLLPLTLRNIRTTRDSFLL